MLYNILLVFEVLFAIALVALILLQQGKGADAGAAFGSGASGTVFGSRGAGSFLSRTTAVLATLFFLNCLALAYLISHRTESSTEFKSVVEGSVIPGQGAEVPAVTDENSPVDIPEVPAEPVSTKSLDIPEAPAESANTKPADIPEAPTEPASTKPADIPE